MRLQGRTAVITGAGSGIGRASALLFAREGAFVALVDRDEAGVQETLDATNDLLKANGFEASDSSSNDGDEQVLEALYVTGGGSELPIVARLLREAFGRRVRRSSYTRSATAIGLAIRCYSSHPREGSISWTLWLRCRMFLRCSINGEAPFACFRPAGTISYLPT